MSFFIPIDTQDPKQVFNKEGALCHRGTGHAKAGDLHLSPSEAYYCGRKMNQCRCGDCDGMCGPTDGCPCNACVELVGFTVKNGKLVKAAVAGEPVTVETAAPGLRVRRGKDWKWDDQDGGEGSLGTLSEPSKTRKAWYGVGEQRAGH